MALLGASFPVMATVALSAADSYARGAPWAGLCPLLAGDPRQPSEVGMCSDRRLCVFPRQSTSHH